MREVQRGKIYRNIERESVVHQGLSTTMCRNNYIDTKLVNITACAKVTIKDNKM